jgi:hypothetical protein
MTRRPREGEGPIISNSDGVPGVREDDGTTIKGIYYE